MSESVPQLVPEALLQIQQQQTPEQAVQYPGFQEAAGLNGKMAGRVIELANRINTAQDIQERHPGLDPTILEQDITDAYGKMERHIGHLAAQNLALKSNETAAQAAPAEPEPKPYGQNVRRMTVNTDGQLVPYGQMTRAVGGGRVQQTGRVVYR